MGVKRSNTDMKGRRKPTVMSKQEAEDATPDLPPAGYKRKEELSRRTDQLEEQAASMPDTYSIDPKKMQIDPEIAKHFNSFDELDVSNPQKAYAYQWIATHRGGSYVQRKVALGWEIIKGDMPEAVERAESSDLSSGKPVGVRRVGDVILMRIRKDRLYQIRMLEKQVRDQQQGLATAGLEDLAASRGVRVQHLSEVTEADFKRGFAQQMAGKAVDQHLRKGTMPGMEVRR